jgi:hypothetical protein
MTARAFEKELQGEEPPSLDTARDLCQAADRFYRRRLWDRLREDQLVFLRRGGADEPLFCGLTGALGEVFSLTAYLGAESYEFFQKLHHGAIHSVGEFYSEQRSIGVYFVARSELTRPDREFLRAAGHGTGKGERVPQFRAIRPGYHAWYVTEAEARILVECLTAMTWFSDFLSAGSGEDYWEQHGTFPLLTPAGDGYAVSRTKAPEGTVELPALPAVDRKRVQSILGRRLPRRGILQVDHFYGGGMIGKKDERKFCIRLALAIDGETAFAYPPQVADPQAALGDLLSNVVLDAIEAGGALPRQVQVRDSRYRILLKPLADCLSIEVVTVPGLPALDFAKGELLRMMGDPQGPLGGL